MQRPRRAAPVHGGELPAQHGGQGGLAVLLGGACGCSGGNVRHHVHQQLRSQHRQAVMKSYHSLVGINGGGGLGDDVAGIQIVGHVHDGHAGFAVPIEHCPVDGRRPPVFGQQGRVDVDASLGGRGQDLIRQDAAVGGHHDQLWGQFLNQRQSRSVPQLDGLIDRDIVGQSAHLDRRCLELHATVPGLVGLGEYPADRVPGGNERFQGGYSKIGGAHKQNSHSPCSSIMRSSSSVV